MNKLLKAYYNNLRTDKTVSGLCELIINSFLPDLLQKYTVANTKFSSEFKLYDPSVPAYLHNQSHYFVKHCMLRIHSAKSDYQSGDIVQQGPTTFYLREL